jgi:hypothetical protein
MQVVAAYRARVRYNVPRPNSDGLPLLHLEERSVLVERRSGRRRRRGGGGYSTALRGTCRCPGGRSRRALPLAGHPLDTAFPVHQGGGISTGA